MMKILHITPYYLPAERYGGPVFSISGLTSALAERGHEVDLFTTNIDGKNNSNVPLCTPVNINGVKVTYFPSSFLRRLFWSSQMVEALNARIKDYDIVHLHTVYVWPTVAGANAARKHGIPYILAPRGMLENNLIRRKSRFVKQVWLNLYGKRIVKECQTVHVTTEREADELKKLNLCLPDIKLIPNGVSLPLDVNFEENFEEGIGHNEYVLFLSRVSWEKGLDRLIPAWRYGIDIPLVVAGNDEENYIPKLKKIAIQEGVEEKIHFIGQVASDKKWALLKNAKMLVLPSYSENFGNVLLEAMIVGCPVVVTPEVGLSPMVKESGAGIVVEGKPESIANGIKMLLSNDSIRIEMGKKGREKALTDYSWSKIAEDMESVYQHILSKQTKPGFPLPRE